METKENLYIYFKRTDNDIDNLISPEELLDNYIEEYNTDGAYAREIVYTAISNIYNISII